VTIVFGLLTAFSYGYADFVGALAAKKVRTLTVTTIAFDNPHSCRDRGWGRYSSGLVTYSFRDLVPKTEDKTQNVF
jgi:hypothetical protein